MNWNFSGLHTIMVSLPVYVPLWFKSVLRIERTCADLICPFFTYFPSLTFFGSFGVSSDIRSFIRTKRPSIKNMLESIFSLRSIHIQNSFFTYFSKKNDFLLLQRTLFLGKFSETQRIQISLWSQPKISRSPYS